MAKPFDNVTKFIHSVDRHALLNVLNINADTIEVCDTDLSTVSSQADLLLLLDKRYALHIEYVVNYKLRTGGQLADYSVFAGKKLKVPVRSVLLQLRPAASGPWSNGVHIRRLPDGTEYLRFQYEVVQVWKLPAEKLFACGLGALPLAFIGEIEPDRIPALVERTRARLKRDTDPKTAADIWTSIDVLMGLRYEREQVEHWLKGVREMEESVTYQAIVEKGEARGLARGEARGRKIGEALGKKIGEAQGLTKEARAILLKLGTERFGEPAPRVLAKLNKINAKKKLEDLVLRSIKASSWSDLFN